MTEPVAAARPRVSTFQAAFIGVASMVGAGIFSLLGSAGEVAGSAVWLSFLLAGIIAGLQGYSFARLGARYPSAGGLLEYLNKGYGPGRIATITAWLTFMANILITAMVAISFGSYASSALGVEEPVVVKAAAVALVVVMTALNVAGSKAVARVQSVIVFVVVGILGLFAVVTIANIDPQLLAPSGYPAVRDIVSSIALTFFAFLGFGVVTFTARDLADPARQLPRAMTIAIGLASLVYVAVALGVFGTLTVEEVIDAGPTAIAVAAEPTLGQLGFWLITLTALFATAGATNAGLFPATGVTEHLSSTGQFPPVMAARIGGRVNVGLLVSAIAVVALVIPFGLSAIASIGSAVALMIFALISGGHLRIRSETGANLGLLVAAVGSTLVVLVVFVLTTLIQEPATVVTLVAILAISVLLDFAWSRQRAGRAEAGA